MSVFWKSGIGQKILLEVQSTIGLRRPTSLLGISAVAVAIIIKGSVIHTFWSVFEVIIIEKYTRHTFYYKIENACLLCNTIQYNTIVIMNQICIIFAIVIVLSTNSITAWTPIVTSLQRIRTTSLLSKAGSVSKLQLVYLYFMSRILIKIIQHRNIQDFKIVMIPMMIV